MAETQLPPEADLAGEAPGIEHQSVDPATRAALDQLEASRRQQCQQSNVRLERSIIQLERSITQRAQKPVTVQRITRSTRARSSHARVRSSRGPPSDDDGSGEPPPPPGAVAHSFAVLFGGLEGAKQHASFVALPRDSEAAFWADIGREANARNELLRVAS